MKALIGILSLLFSTSLGAQAIDPGLGDLHHAVSTQNAEAQQYFDQGLRYVFAFNHEMAVKSFQHATELDPNLGIGYWGAALALGPNINMDVDPDHEKMAWEAEQKALAHLDGASGEERDLINTLARRYSNDPQADLKKLAAAYSQSMGELTRKYPDDLDLATLYAESLMDLRPWKFWDKEGHPAEGTEQIVAVLESVLKRNPKHLGANHYYIHAVEASAHPEKALPSARRIAALAPAAGHLVHMPAHILQRTGDYAAAAKANEDAARVDRDFIKKYGAENMYSMMYYNHNLQFGTASYTAIGRYADAKRMADEFAMNCTMAVKVFPPVEIGAAYPINVLLRFGKWRDVLRTPDPAVGPVSTFMWHYGRGVAMAKLGNALGAESELAVLRKTRDALSEEPGVMQNTPRSIGEVAIAALQGHAAMAAGNRAGAIDAFRKAVALEDQLGYDEPPDWYYPVRESLGAALVRDGQFAEAEKVFREDLVHNPHNPRSLYGLAQALKRQKKNGASVNAELTKSWKGSALRIEDL